MTMSMKLEPVGAQERWDQTFSKLGRSAPVRRADESGLDYERRLARVGKKYLPADERITRVRFDASLPDEVVTKFSEMVREAVERNIVRTDNMRRVTRINAPVQQAIYSRRESSGTW
jgi:hypothetical protein